MKLTTIIREKWTESKWWPVFLWSFLIFFGSSLPPLKVSQDTLLDFLIHKGVHLLEYTLLAFFTWRATRDFRLSLLFPIFYALTDEWHQSFTQGRMSRGQDVAWDSLAVLLGNLFVRLRSARWWGFGGFRSVEEAGDTSVVKSRSSIFYGGRGLARRRDDFVKEGVSASVEETQRLAREILAHLGERNLVALYGELGSGKTVFVQGLAQALGLRETVSSPSFVLVKEYSLTQPFGPFKKLVHVDLYRLASPQEAQTLLLEELVASGDNLVVVEWAERWVKLPTPVVKIYFRYLDERKRHWRVEEKGR